MTFLYICNIQISLNFSILNQLISGCIEDIFSLTDISTSFDSQVSKRATGKPPFKRNVLPSVTIPRCVLYNRSSCRTISRKNDYIYLYISSYYSII